MVYKHALYRFDEEQLNKIIVKGFEQFKIDDKLKKAKLVMIKPNLVSDVKEYIEQGSNSDIRIIEAVLKYLSKYDVKVVVAESETGTKMKGRKLKLALDYMGVTALKQKYNFDIVNLTYDKQILIKFDKSLILKKLYLGKTSLDADVIINIPKLKTHKYATITCALKNMFGCIPDPCRVIYHRNIHKTLADLNTKFIDKTFVVLDGIKAMEGKGPLYGTAVDMNLIGFCDDMLINDVIASRIMGFIPSKVLHIKYFKEKYHNINVKDIMEIGDLRAKDVTRKFKPSEKNWFVKIEEQLMRNRVIVKILFSDFVRKNITYRFRKILKKFRGGSYSWYVKDEKNKINHQKKL